MRPHLIKTGHLISPLPVEVTLMISAAFSWWYLSTDTTCMHRRHSDPVYPDRYNHRANSDSDWKIVRLGAGSLLCVSARFYMYPYWLQLDWFEFVCSFSWSQRDWIETRVIGFNNASPRYFWMEYGRSSRVARRFLHAVSAIGSYRLDWIEYYRLNRQLTSHWCYSIHESRSIQVKIGDF